MPTIDRLSPTRRPGGRVAQRQSWRDLLFLHWPVPASALRALVPAGLEIDTFEGDAYVGLVPFTMRGVRPVWAPPVPGVSTFHETNVRTYVHRGGRDPGVWFFSLDAASRLAVWIARTFWGLPYFDATMSLARGDDARIRYATQRRGGGSGSCIVEYTPEGGASPAALGTKEHFLAERYILYAPAPGGALRRGRVSHTPYRLQTARVHEWREDLLAAAGIVRSPGEPLAHYASGVDVEVFALERLDDAQDSGSPDQSISATDGPASPMSGPAPASGSPDSS